MFELSITETQTIQAGSWLTNPDIASSRPLLTPIKMCLLTHWIPVVKILSAPHYLLIPFPES